VQYAWDEAKAAANLAKHGISFTAAARALEDPQKVEIIDDRFDYGEERIQNSVYISSKSCSSLLRCKMKTSAAS